MSGASKIRSLPRKTDSCKQNRTVRKTGNTYRRVTYQKTSESDEVRNLKRLQIDIRQLTEMRLAANRMILPGKSISDLRSSGMSRSPDL